MRKKRYCTKQPLSATIASPGHILLNIQVSKTFTKKCTFYIWPLPPPFQKRKYICVPKPAYNLPFTSATKRDKHLWNSKRETFLKGQTGFDWVYLNSFFFRKIFRFQYLAVKCYSWLNALWWGNKLDPRRVLVLICFSLNAFSAYFCISGFAKKMIFFYETTLKPSLHLV